MEKRTQTLVSSKMHRAEVKWQEMVGSVYSTVVLVQKLLLVLLHQYQYQVQAPLYELKSVNIMYVRGKSVMGRKKGLYVVQMASSIVTSVSLESPSV
jgi:hypothetical protein